MALVREGSAQSANGNLKSAEQNFAEAKAVFERLRAAGDHGEDVTLGLALTLFARSDYVVSGGGVGGSEAELKRAAELLKPLAHVEGASRRVRRQYAEILNYVSHIGPKEQGIANCEEARALLVGLGALDLTDLGAASAYADVSDSEARHAMVLGRLADAEKLEHETYDIAEKVLARRPGDLRSMANRALAANVLGALAARRGDYREAIRQASSSERAGEDYVRFNPADLNAWQYVVIGQSQLAAYELELGQVSEALAQLRAASALDQDSRSPSGMGWLLLQTRIELMRLESRSGQRAAAQQVLKQIAGAVDERRSRSRATRSGSRLLVLGPSLWGPLSEFALGDFRARVWRSGRDRPASRRPADLGRQHVGQQHARFFAARRASHRDAVRTRNGPIR
jgi:tetratricopeptide (TPR) repeat protein